MVLMAWLRYDVECFQGGGALLWSCVVKHPDVDVTARKEESFILTDAQRQEACHTVHRGALGWGEGWARPSTVVSMEETSETPTQAWESV